MSAFVVWNNKGGVGKSTLVFHMASCYARDYPDQKVCVIDLSPQCDVSRMILGGGCNDGEGVILEIMKRGKTRKTIGGYLRECHSQVPAQGKYPTAAKFISNPSEVRSHDARKIPGNLRLLCGDFDLERTMELITQLSTPPLRGGISPSGPQYSAPLLVRTYIRNIVESMGDQMVFFIDTDPYYSIATTHMGIFAADRWITIFAPGSLASQYAVYRSIDALYDKTFGLSRLLQVERNVVPEEWYANNGKPLRPPKLQIPPCRW